MWGSTLLLGGGGISVGLRVGGAIPTWGFRSGSELPRVKKKRKSDLRVSKERSGLGALSGGTQKCGGVPCF